MYAPLKQINYTLLSTTAREKLHTFRLNKFATRAKRPVSDPLFYLNATDLPRISLAGAIHRNEGGVFVPTDCRRQFTRVGPEFFDNPGGYTGFDVSTIEITCPPPFLISSHDALLTGYRTIITSTNQVVNDDCISDPDIAAFLKRLGNKDDCFESEEAGLILGSEVNGLRLLNPDLPAINIKGSTVLLSSEEPRNYGSLIFRVLPKIYSTKRLGLEKYNFLVPKLGRATDELLELIGLPRHRIIEHKSSFRYRCDHILAPSQRNNQAYLDPEILDFIGSLRERFGKPRKKGKRVFVSRHRINLQNKSYRMLINENELIERLIRMGFEIFYPEEHSVTEQIETFSSASMVVGPSGAGMFNAVFCWPGTKLIDIESEPWWLHAHMCLFSSCRLKYGIIVGHVDPTDDSIYHKRWNVDVDLVCKRIEEFERAS